MNKKTLLVSLLSLGLLVSCGGPTGSTASGTSQAGSAAASSSVQHSSVTPVASVTIAGADLEVGTVDEKPYLVITGTIRNFATVDAMKFAFGFTHKEATGIDDGTGGFVFGAATPAATDYNVAPVVEENGSFVCKLDLAVVTEMVVGAYSVWAGPKNFYQDVTTLLAGDTSGEGSLLGGGKANNDGLKLYFRADLSALMADALPPVAMTDAYVEKGTDDKPYLFIGGELGVDAAVWTAYLPFVNFQVNGTSDCLGYTGTNNWSNTRMDVTTNMIDSEGASVSETVESGLVSCVVIGNDGFVKIDISSLADNGYNTHLNVFAKTQADCKMDNAIDTTAAPIVIGTHQYSVWSDPSLSGGANYWGNLALIVAPLAEAASSVAA